MAASTITTGTHPKLYFMKLKELWGLTYPANKAEYNDLFGEGKTSEQSYEEVQEIVGTGLAPAKSEGAPAQFDSTSAGSLNRATHTAFALGAVITFEALQDNLYLKKGEQIIPALKFSMTQTKETVLANIYNNGFDSNYAFGDGVAMISASHPTLSGNQSNVVASNAPLSEIALEDALVQIANAQNARGLQIALTAESLHIPANEMFNATRILKSSLQNDTAENAINALKFMGVLPKGIKVNHYFDDTNAWFVRTNCPGGMMLFNRNPLMLDQDNDFDTKNARFLTYERYSATFGDWRCIYGSTGG